MLKELCWVEEYTKELDLWKKMLTEIHQIKKELKEKD